MNPRVPIAASGGLVDWMVHCDLSLAFSTYQTGKLLLVGHSDRKKLSGYERTFERAMGLAGNAQTIFMASQFQLWRLENVLQRNESLKGYDRLYVPQVGQTTGDLDIHDVAVDGSGRPIFVSARFNCLAETSDRYHFKPLWVPSFITKLVGEDRCHLNGLALVDGIPRYVTACSQTDVVDRWRDHRRDGGVVIDTENNRVIAHGLSMPHSPRWYRDRLWCLDSGNGFFGFVDIDSGKFEPVTLCPGFARGLSFVDDYAVVGLSLPRHEPTFEGLALQDRLTESNLTPRCGLIVIDLNTGDIAEWLTLNEPVRELYDVLVLPGVRRPRLVGFQTDEIQTTVWADPEGVRQLGRPT